MTQQIQKRYSQNFMAFLMIYALVGITVGLIFDVMITYLQAVSTDTAKSLTSLMGISTFAAAALALLGPRLGYKKMIISVPIVIAISLLLIANSRNQWCISAATLLLLTGSTLFDVILAPYVAAYTTGANRTALFTKTMYANVFGIVFGTMIGGPTIVWLFSKKLNIAYYQAKLLTENISGFSFQQLSCYIDSHRMILMGFTFVALLMLIPGLMIKEAPEDYCIEAKDKDAPVIAFSVLINKYIVLFLLYTIARSFAGSLVVPHLSIYLSKIGINRAAVSMLSTLQYMAILIFMLFTPVCVKKLGQIKAISLLCFTAIPFMLILANGYSYSGNTELVVGTALFFRAGLMNAAGPIVTSLTMTLVSKNHRSLYASMVFVIQGLAQIAAGLFTKFYLFNLEKGYADAYYLAALLYFVSHVMLLFVFSKKYNKLPQLQGEAVVS